MLNYRNMDRLVVPAKGIAKRGVFLSRRALQCWGNAQNRRSALILQYHSIHPAGQKRYFSYVNPSLSVCMDVFDRQLAFMNRHFEVVTLDKLLAYVKGDCRISGQPVAITFDDGYQDNYLYAFPQLLKYGFPATFYLTTDCIGAKRPLWTTELRYIFLRSPKSFLSLTSLPIAFSMKTALERSLAIAKLKSKIVFMEKRGARGNPDRAPQGSGHKRRRDQRSRRSNANLGGCEINEALWHALRRTYGITSFSPQYPGT